MASTQLPGLNAQHVVITDVCRTNRGDTEAFDVAVERLRAMYEHVVSGWTVGKGVRIHLALTVERPAATAPDSEMSHSRRDQPCD